MSDESEYRDGRDWRSDADLSGGIPTGGYRPPDVLRVGPEPTGSQRVSDLLRPYLPANALGDRISSVLSPVISSLGPDNYDMGREVGRGGNPGMLVASLIPGMRPATKAVQSAARAGENVLAKGIRAYHGSPHDFDRFDISKIGTGEGAQAYGHGLYFAEAEDVAKGYKTRLTDARAATDAVSPEAALQRALDGSGGDVIKARESLESNLRAIMRTREKLPTYGDDQLAKYEGALKMLDEGRHVAGRMYEVNIKANPDDFLDWDKPLSQQSENVRKKLKEIGLDENWQKAAGGYKNDVRWTGNQKPSDAAEKAMDRLLNETNYGTPEKADLNAYIHSLRMTAIQNRNNANGKRLMQELADLERDAPFIHVHTQRTEDALKAAGIPGTKYLDQGSRTAGEGSRNYVVFDDALVEILRKYGLLPPLAGGAVAAASRSDDVAPGQYDRGGIVAGPDQAGVAVDNEIRQLLEQYAPVVDVWPGERPDLMRNVDRERDRELGWAAAPGWRDEHEPNVGWEVSLPDPLAKARNVISDVLGPSARKMGKVMRDSGAGFLSNFLSPTVSQGMFLTPFRVANLEQAGFVKPGGWRSLAALEQAREAASLGMSAPDIWRRFGWNLAGNDPWGKIPGTFRTSDFAPLDTSDLRIASQGRPRAVGELISGRTADELFAADPRLRDMTVTFENPNRPDGPNATYAGGTRRIRSGDVDNILADGVPGARIAFYDMEPGHPLFESTARHELSHAVSQSGMPGSAPAVPFAGRDMPDRFYPSSRVADAPYHAPLARELDELKALSHGLPFNDPRQRDLARSIQALNQAKNEADAVANYHNARHEVSAREGAERVGMTLDEQRRTPVGSIPLFTNDALPSWSILPNHPDMVARGIALGDLEIPYQNFRAAGRRQ